MQCLYDHPDYCSLVIDDKLAIYAAIEQGLSMDIIKQMLISYPACRSRKDKYGYLLLHDLLLNINRIMSSYVHLIIDANIEAVGSIVEDDSLPLHIECLNQCRYDVIIMLLDIYPDSIRITNRGNRYPLHYALESEYGTYEVISYRIQLYPEAVRIPGEEGKLPLHYECSKYCRYDVIIKLLDIYPDVTKNGYGKYSLHEAMFCDHNTAEAILCLINANADAIHIHDDNGELPVHIECYNKCRYDIVVKLLEFHPDAINIRGINIYGHLPLHYALCSAHSSYEVISYLIDLKKDAVQVKDIRFDLPLHLECSLRCRHDVIKKL